MTRILKFAAMAAIPALVAGAMLVAAGGAGPIDPRLSPSHTCSDCHATHEGRGPSLLVASDVEVLCLTCHGPGGASAVKAQNHEGHTCTACHNPHDGEFNRFGRRNLKMMRAVVVPRGTTTQRPLTFESRGTDVGQPVLHSFCDDDLDGDHIYDNACDTCHRSEPDDHRYTDPGSHGHRAGRTCTVCHTHTRGFREP